MLHLLWLLVLCCVVRGQKVEEWTRETTMTDSGWKNETVVNHSERCKLCNNLVLGNISHIWGHIYFWHVMLLMNRF